MVEQRPLAIVRRPGPRLIEGIAEFESDEPVRLDLAIEQWENYIAALRAAGWILVECPPADDCPDAVFIEDPVVVFGDVAVVCRPGAPTRRPEIDAIGPLFTELGLSVVHLMAGSLDGGDVLKVGTTVYVGLSERTDAEGVAELARILGAGWEVRAVPITGVLHLKSAITALPTGQIIGLGECVDTDVVGNVRAMPESHGAHVVEIGPNHLLVAASAPETVALLRAEGYTVSEVDISEFEKLDGCVTCLSVRVRS